MMATLAVRRTDRHSHRRRCAGRGGEHGQARSGLLSNSPHQQPDETMATCGSRAVTLRADEAQFSQLLENVKPPARFDLKDLASLIQVLALVVGGGWAFYEFLSFRSE